MFEENRSVITLNFVQCTNITGIPFTILVYFILNVLAQSWEKRSWRLAKSTPVFWLPRTGKRLKRQPDLQRAKEWYVVL